MPFWDRRPIDPANEASIERFVAALPPDDGLDQPSKWDDAATRKLLGHDDATFTAFISRYAGRSFGGGLFRALPIEGALGLSAWNGRLGWRMDWPSVPRSIAFAADWRGNLYLLDERRTTAGERRIAWLDIATGELESPDVAFSEFLGAAVPGMHGTLLDEALYSSWLSGGGARPSSEQCIGHKVPMILGGANDAANLEVLSLLVWVSMCGQIYEQVKNLPPGTKITGFQVKS
jgi:hypothetical protein